MRIGMIVLSAALVAMWLVGIVTHQPAWLGWLDLVLGIVSLLATLAPLPGLSARVLAPFVIGVALTALWIAAFARGITTWLAWATFLTSVAYFALGAIMGEPMSMPPHRVRT